MTQWHRRNCCAFAETNQFGRRQRGEQVILPQVAGIDHDQTNGRVATPFCSVMSLADSGGREMNAKAVRDVIGEPETWSNHFHVAGEGPTDIRGATISQVFSAGNDIAVCTEGGACGATFTVFAVEDKELRDRI